MAVLSCLLVAPLLVSWQPGEGLRLGLPQIRGGDEPHYLVMISSVLEDGDLALEDDYTSAHAGSGHAGRAFSGMPLDHHTMWFHGEQRIHWPVWFEVDAPRWRRDASGAPLPTPRRPKRIPPGGTHEWSTHPPGQALVFGALLLPFAGSAWVEPGAIVLSALAVVAGAFAFRSLLRAFSSSAVAIDLATAVAFLGTPAWPYARTLFTEPLLLLLATAAYALVLRRNSDLAAGALLGLGLLVKPPFAVLVLPLILFRLRADRPLAACSLLAAPVIVALLVLLALNEHMFGSPWRTSIEWKYGSVWSGIAGLITSRDRGLLWLAPGLAMMPIAWVALLRRNVKHGATVLLGFLVYLAAMASWHDWTGGVGYGPRLIVPVIPFAFAAAVAITDPSFPSPLWLRRSGYVLCATGIAINLIAALSDRLDSRPITDLADAASRLLAYVA